MKRNIWMMIIVIMITSVMLLNGCMTDPAGPRTNDTATTSSTINGGGQTADPVITASITANPKLIYTQGETFSLDGIKVTVYADGQAVADLTNDAAFQYNSPNMNETGTKTVGLSFSYQNKSLTVTLTITVNEDPSHGYRAEISDNNSLETIMRIGEYETLPLDGLCVNVYDSEGTSVIKDQYIGSYYNPRIISADMTKVGKQTVTVSFEYSGNTITVSYEIDIYMALNISLTLSDVTVDWDGLKDEIDRFEAEAKSMPNNYIPMDWSKAIPDNTVDWAKVGDVTIDVSAVDTVDLVSLSVLKKYVETKLQQAENSSSDIKFTDYKENATFDFDLKNLEDKNIDNVQFMHALVNPYELEFDKSKMKTSETSVAGYGREGTDDRIDSIIPGVQLISFPSRYFDPKDSDNIIVQSFKFDQPTDVTMPEQYNLTGTYKGGIIRDNVNFTNLQDTDMTGDVYKYDIKSIYETFVENKPNLPNLSIKYNAQSSDYYISYKFGKEEANAYGTKLDEIIKTYYASNANIEKFNFERGNNCGVVSFDGAEHVLNNGGTMYEGQGNTYNGNAYPLDINAALVMSQAGFDISDVDITGDVHANNHILGTEDSSTTYINIRFSTDMSDISFASNTGARGIIDIAGAAPAGLPAFTTDSALIVRKSAVNAGVVNNDQNFHTIDFRELDASDASSITGSGSAFTGFYKDDAAKSAIGGADYKYNLNELDDQLTIKEIEVGIREGHFPSEITHNPQS